MGARKPRLLIALFTLCALLFTQGALAAYLCPGLADVLEVAQMAQAQMPCAEGMAVAMDEQQPALCHAHCQTAQGTLEPSQHGQLQAAALPAVAVLTIAAAPVVARGDAPRQPLRSSAGPPLAIRYCCFRI